MSYARNAKLAAYQTVAVHGGVANADPHAMVLMLMDAVMERMAIARGCMERRESQRQASLLHSCVNIITELRGSLNMNEGGTLAQNLSDLYEYMIRRLVVANASSDTGCITEISGLMEDLRSAWIAIGPEVRKAPGAPTLASANASVSPAYGGARHG